MAKSKSFFGIRTGSTKSHTYQYYRGMQITKDRVEKVSNPQTSGQMAQRLKLVSVANAAAQLKGLINHSFEGVDYGWKSVQEFRRRNLSKPNLEITGYVPKGANDCGLANFVVSAGSLIGLPFSTSSLTPTDDAPYLCRTQLIADTYEPSSGILSVVSPQEPRIKPTAANMEILSHMFGIEQGQQITLLYQIANTEKSSVDVYTSDGTSEYFRSKFYIARIITDYTDENFMTGWRVSDTSNNSLEADNVGDFHLSFETINDDSSIKPSFVLNADMSATNFVDKNAVVMASAIILSDKSGDVYKRSISRLVPTTSGQHYAWSYDKAVDTYLKDNGTSDKYLNAGNVSVEILPM